MRNGMNLRIPLKETTGDGFSRVVWDSKGKHQLDGFYLGVIPIPIPY